MHGHALISILGKHLPKKPMNAVAWNSLLQAARKTELLGQLGSSLYNLMPSNSIHWRIRRALDLELLTAQRRGEAALWEVRALRRLIPTHIPIVALKGSAYALANDRNAQGRLFSDIDLLVPAEHLGEVESVLISGGWKPSNASEYDQRYYREWMHELPPMEHVRRHTVVDLHHAIIPPVSRFAFDPAKLFKSAIEISPGIFILCPADRIIHSAIHAFLEGVPAKALRDLYDINSLLRQHFPDAENLNQVIERAGELGVEALAVAALESASVIFSNAVTPPEKCSVRGRWLAKAALSVIQPTSPSGIMAQQVLLAHSHWIKMPWRLLVPHLFRKAWLSLFHNESLLAS